MGNTERTEFDSSGFKLLWEKEKGIITNQLKKCINKKSELKDRVVAAVPEAAAFY